MPHPTEAEVDAIFNGRFVTSACIGIGGQGVVYRARRVLTADNQVAADDVALKLHTDPAQDQRIQRELGVMEGMRHPNLAKLVEHGVVRVAGAAVRYAAWEFIEGESLADRLRSGRLHPKTVCAIGRDVATAIDHLWGHERVVHRDVNPKNIMLRVGDREAVLIDLGIAKHRSQPPITGPAVTWGTIGYFSPEQAQAHQNLTSSSDIFSLAVTMQEALLGRHPTGGRQEDLRGGVPSTVSICPSAPGALGALLDRMGAGRAAFRPSPRTVADELTTLVAIL